MEGSIPRKVLRLAGHLARRPGDVPRWLGDRMAGRRSTLDQALPWFSFAAIDFLEGFLTSAMTVAEYGSGGSTLFFARRTAAVLAVEDSAEWAEAVRQRLTGLGNVDLRQVTADFDAGPKFADSAYLHAPDGQRFDVVVVDSPDNLTRYDIRPQVFAHAETLVKPGGIVILDDAWHYPQLREATRARDVRAFRSAGPARPGVTVTEIHFY